MPEHHSPCPLPVSLPSIHEMFPAHLLRPEDGYNNRHKYPEHRHQSGSPPQRLPQTHPYSHHTETIAHDPRLHDSDPRSPPTDPRKRSASHVYSFDVLRSDPMNSSLQHLTSTGTLPNHPSNQQQQHSSPNSPAFRVSVPPTTAANIHHPLSIEARSRAPQRTDPDPVVPAIISFPVSRSPVSGSESSKPSQSPFEDSASDDDNPGESAGKKHICPTCLKRFNRPSSLRIHVNTHTGATPFRCPWPNCGREFNVNSNMRRHYRNHTTPGFSRAQPNDTRRKRRRVDALDVLSHPPPYNLSQSMSRVAVVSTKPQQAFSSYGPPRYHQRQQYPQYPPRSLTPGSDSSSPLLHPASMSSAPLTRHSYPLVHAKREHKYNPSAPYMHSLADTRVSTALRPAFHS